MLMRTRRDGHFASDRFHEKLLEYRVPHVLEYHAAEKHRWDSGWLPRAVAYLFLENLPEGTGR